MSVVGPRPIVDKELVRYGPYMDDVASVHPELERSLMQVSWQKELELQETFASLIWIYAPGRSFGLDSYLVHGST